MSRGTHFVHPGQTVAGVSSNDEPCIAVYFQRDVETLRGHVGIDLIAGVPFSEDDSEGMALNDLLNDVL